MALLAMLSSLLTVLGARAGTFYWVGDDNATWSTTVGPGGTNWSSSPDFNSAQLEGKYFYAPTAADVGPAFEGIQNQILRLSK